MALIQSQVPVGDSGERCQGRRYPMKVRGMYILRLLLRKMMKRTTITTKEMRAGIRVVSRPDSDGVLSCGLSL